MNTIKMAITLLLLSWHTCWAATPLGDIDVKLEVTAQPRIEIENRMVAGTTISSCTIAQRTMPFMR